MATYVSATEAARMLGVTKPTLYAYVSRGIVGRSTAADGRTSLYAREEIQRLAGRAHAQRASAPATIDVQISSAITELQDEGVTYRGHDAAELARSHSFEQVAVLLWTGTLGQPGLGWPLDRDDLSRCRNVVAAAGAHDVVAKLTLAATALAQGAGDDDAPTAARRLLTIAPSLLGGPVTGDIGTRLTAAYRRRPAPELVDAVSRALVLLADHELATSTLAVRVACSVRADPYAAITAGLCVVGGALHGTASTAAAEVLDDTMSNGARDAVNRVLSSGQRLPGFGHSVYRNGDPRLAPLLDAVRALPDSDRRMQVVEELLVEAGRRLGQLPNVDLGLGALAFVADLPRDASLFAVARIAGWAAHYEEEKSERPVRYRGITTHA